MKKTKKKKRPTGRKSTQVASAANPESTQPAVAGADAPPTSTPEFKAGKDLTT